MRSSTVPKVSLVVVAIVASLAGAVSADEAPRSGASSASMRRISAGSFVPFYGGKPDRPLKVRAFFLDVEPVTNADFLRFVRNTPRFRRSQIARLFADSGYLSRWAADLELGSEARPRQPVTFVSWFAARAYCDARGARLPSEAEWELAAQADATRPDAHRDPTFVSGLLEWYSHPAKALREVRSSKPNVFGIFDLHGLVWEWIEDFNASIVSADDRARDDDQVQRICGGGAVGSNDPADYAAFMRYAFRSSLKAGYTVHNLGFRCAMSAE